MNDNKQDTLWYPCLEGSLFTSDMEPPLTQVLHHLEIELFDSSSFQSYHLISFCHILSPLHCSRTSRTTHTRLVVICNHTRLIFVTTLVDKCYHNRSTSIVLSNLTCLSSLFHNQKEYHPKLSTILTNFLLKS